MNLVAACIVIGTLNVWTLLPSAAVFVISFYLRNVYLETSRDLKRIEAASKSFIVTFPLYSLKNISL